MVKTKLTSPRSSATTRAFLIGALSLVLSGAALADSHSEAMDWLQKMKVSMQELSYQGRFVYQHNDQLESMSLVRVYDEKGVRERLVSLNGEAREILRDDQNLTCVWPSSRQVVVDPADTSQVSPIWIPDDLKRLAKFYRFETVGNSRVAGHDAIVIQIEPRDQYRYGMKVWLDTKHGLLLQSDVLGEQGQVVERVMFTELALIPDQARHELGMLPEIDDGYTLIRSHQGDDSGAMTTGDTRWRLQAVPGGFWLESSYQKRMATDQPVVQHMVYTDGMASVSVFIESMQGSQRLAGESSMGAVNAYSTEYGEHTVTAIGEVPAVTVREMAVSITFLDQ